MNEAILTRVFVIGGEAGESAEIDGQLYRIAKRLGEELGKRRNVQIVVCSAHRSSVDAGVIEGFANTSVNLSGSVVIHHPLDNRPGLAVEDSITGQWRVLIEKAGLVDPQFRPNSNARVLDKSAFSNAFLLCQIRALREDTDVIVALGGKRNASASLLMSIARDTYPIVPFSFMGGAAEQEYLRQESIIRSAVSSKKLIDSLESESGIARVLELIDKTRHVHGNYQIFMSYSWDRKEDADYVEAFLRRDQRVTLFRDEDEIKTGEPISDRIKAQLENCDVFLILWCAEYTTSPNCYDELQIASKRSGCMIYVLRLDATRPVWPVLRKSDSHDWNKKWLEPPKKSKDRRGVIAASLNEMRTLLTKKLK